MLLTQLLAEHPEAAADIVRHTPLWVAGVLAGLTVLGLSATRTRVVHLNRLLLMPLVMGALALWGVQSAFDASGRLTELLALWAACYAAMLAIGTRLSPPAGAAYELATRSFRLPGSWVPLGLILAVFLMKYGIGVQLALEPSLARDAGFAFAVTALYGLLSGVFAARSLCVLKLARAAAPQLSAA
ncbi:DUF6622 family protein [Ottowia sp.]|uniref:DUF6622 family protein n=1 Tax=Ottowia sp. TaxID=1898956 RepID=UPI002BABDA99|nr:DUF6622 family protein [Ottowia sp.]HOB65882.1 hypothetical protein [Ottowia sp.]HPZ56865.1 hypothetical protein [Ottowia sp.]HQD47282.1 hypothetical protein [Ottowia sp.]